jgi:hypothetical protein
MNASSWKITQREVLPGAGLSVGAGLGAVVGVLVTGTAIGLVLGGGIGAGVGLIGGAIARNLITARSSTNGVPSR